MLDPVLPAADIDALCRAIAHRRSLGLARLSDEPVDRAILERALEAANWAPSHGDTEPWRFQVFTGNSRKRLGELFAEAYRTEAGDSAKPEAEQGMRDRAFLAPVWISLGVVPKLLADGTPKMSQLEEDIAVGCAAQNLHLVLAAHGLAGMWHSKGPSVSPVVAKGLGLEHPGKLLGFMFCGWPAVAWPEGERGAWTDKVLWHD